MNHRERVLAALSHREPDRVPRFASLTPPVLKEFQHRTGRENPGEYWDWDMAGIGFRRPEPLPDLKLAYGRYFEGLDCEWILDWNNSDYPPEWGVATRPAHYYHFSAPLAPMAKFTSLKELEEYPFPDYIRDWRHDHLEAEVKRLRAEGYPVAAGAGWIFQSAWTLRTRERLFIDFFEFPEFADALLTRVTNVRIAQATRLAQAGADMISLSDDIGTQNSMIMSPAMWRQWIKPHMASLIAAVHRVNPAIHFRYHTDGWIMPVIPDLMDIGVSSLITVQPECMDPFEIKHQFGKHLTLEGTIGVQGVLMSGTAQQVRAMVKAQCEGLKPGGGWMASGANGIEPDIPWDNLVALFEALDEYGQY